MSQKPTNHATRLLRRRHLKWLWIALSLISQPLPMFSRRWASFRIFAVLSPPVSKWLWIAQQARPNPQITQGLIAGRLVNSQTGAPIAGAQISYSNGATGASGVASSDRSGDYSLP